MLGIFDSGVGGLTVVKELLQCYPQSAFVYLGDTARTPYGNKSPDIIKQYAHEDVAFLKSQGATHIVIACNTVSAIALDELKKAFPGLVFFDVISPAVAAAKAIITTRKSKTIGIIGTRATIGSRVYETRLKAEDANLEVIQQACPLFVPLVEENWIEKAETKRIIRTYLQPIRQKQVDALILGCTHYPLLEKQIQACLQKRVRIINSAKAMIDVLESTVRSELEKTGEQSYFFTDPTETTQAIANRWLKRTVTMKKAEL